MNPNTLKSTFVCSLLLGLWPSSARAVITVTMGDFEDGQTGQQLNVAGWFDSSTTGFVEWTNANTSILNDPADGYTQSRHLAMRGDGYVYESLGTYATAAGTVLNWSLYQGVFTDGNASAGLNLTFYAGAFPGAAEGVNLSTAGLSQVGLPATIAALGTGFNSTTGAAAAGYRTGTLSLSSVPNGTELWIKISGTGGTGVFAPIDNVSVTQVPEPGGLLLSMLGMAALVVKRRR